MLRPATALATAALLAACHSAQPMPKALAVRSAFAVEYDGRVSPFSAEDAPAPAEEPRAGSALAPRRVVSFRATWLELTIDEARCLLPTLAARRPPAMERLADGSTRSWTGNGVSTDGPGRSASSSACRRSLGVAGAHVEPAVLREALGELRDRRAVSNSQRGAVGVGDTAELATCSQRAFVKSLRLSTAADSLLVDDVEVGVFQYGSTLRLGASSQGDAVRIDVEWREVTPVLPIPFTDAAMASLQVPVLRRHKLTASTSVTGSDSFVLASLPADAADSVRILCVEVEPVAPVAAR